MANDDHMYIGISGVGRYYTWGGGGYVGTFMATSIFVYILVIIIK